MALPIVRSLEDCASYAITVEPYLDELCRLPATVAAALAPLLPFSSSYSPSCEVLPTLLQLYVNTNPLVSGFAASVALGAVFLVVSEINRNYSQVDRCWSLLPTVYIAHFTLWARLADVPAGRLDAALLASTVWSIRLTYNYARKGGYNVGSEDYRWEIVKNAIPAWLFHVFNLTFISFFQSILLFFISAPAYVLLLASARGPPELTAADVVFPAAQLGLVLVEWFADQQQWAYQTAKRQYQRTARVPAGCGFTQADLDRGFVAEGLWAHSRHPNFAAEQSIWLMLYQWSCFATDVLYHWAGVGAAVLVLLFQGSTALTERITAGKYPEYADYQRRVGMFVPTSLAPYKLQQQAERQATTTPNVQPQTSEQAKASGSEKKGTATRRA
ncbi:hypothetical protein SPI_06494 [Niveomyces insectorum RCEF 264]|uniref:DUF1295 domain containing protein n=1 Tax=Niveomyces insectorum RCEF 264 TaxID=1081102 RepID=A0A167RAR8_9HYPO|nr:hypothetical protein SPI_06494 [Niveomyces insectorum RCEF 264]